MPRNKRHQKPYIKPDYHSQNKQTKTNDDISTHKKMKLRTSLDIYHRLYHDATLNIELKNVLIGYNDNILGEQEICILNWCMIDDGGEIPIHHILYFLLILPNGNKLILWDRKSKLDRLYGSGYTQKQQIFKNMIKSKQIQLSNDDTKNDNDDDNKLNDLNVAKPSNAMNHQYFPRYPVTDDGFVESFEIKDTSKWLKCLNYYGCVVLKVFTENECDLSINAMMNEIYETTLNLRKQANDPYKVYKVDINNPFTWNGSNFPKPNATTFLTEKPTLTKQAFLNRLDDRIYSIFKTLYNGNKILNVNIGSNGIQRGTKNLWFIDPENKNKKTFVAEKRKWRQYLGHHFDINPWNYVKWIDTGYYEHIYQGAVALNEQRIGDGTHITLPGCINYLKTWCKLHDDIKKEDTTRYNMNPNDCLVQYMQPIPLRKGEMVIWDYGQLHANTMNKSDRMRLTQYIRMFPAEKRYIERDKSSLSHIMKRFKDIDIGQLLKKYGILNERNCKLLGLKQW